MNMISTGSFLPEVDASNKQETLAEKFAAVWMEKNSKVARAGGVSLMALSLAACGSSSDTDTDAGAGAGAGAGEGADAGEGAGDQAEQPEAPAALELTTAADTIDEAAGGSYSGTVGLTGSTLNATDNITLGGDDDSLAVTLNTDFGGFTATKGSMTGVETLDITIGTSVARSFDATGATGVNTVNVDMNETSFTYADADAAGLTFNVTNASAASSLTVTYGSIAATSKSTDEITLNVTDAGASKTAVLNVTSANVETLTLGNNGTSNYMDLSIGNAKTIKGKGDAALTVTAVDASLKTWDGDEFGGDQTLTLTAASPTLVETGAGADKVTVKALGSATATLDGGAGTSDELIFSANAGGISQHTIGGFETITFKGLTTAANSFDMTKVSGVTTMQSVDGLDQNLTLSGGTSTNFVFADTAGGTYSGGNTFTSSNTGQFTLTSSTANAAGYSDAVTIVGSKATDVDVTIGADTTFSGTQTYASAKDVDISVAGSLTGAVTAAKAETVDLVATGDGVAFGSTAHSFAASTTTVLGTSNSSDSMAALAISAPAAGNAITINAAGAVGFAAGNDFSGMSKLTVNTSKSFTGTDADLGDASASVTLDASGVTGNVTFTSGTYATGKGSLTVTGSTTGTNTITSDTGRTTIDITGGIAANTIYLAQIATPGATTPVSVKVTTSGVANTDTVFFAEGTGGSGEDLSGTNASVTLSGVDIIAVDQGTGGTLTLDTADISGQSIQVGDGTSATDLVLTGTASAETVNLASVTLGASSSVTVNAGGGADIITGGAGVDVINGQDGADQITGGNGADVITGGDGADRITLTESTAAADDVVLTDDDAVDHVIGFSQSGLDEIFIDVSEINTELGAGSIVSEAGTAQADASAQATGIGTFANAATLAASGGSEELFQITTTTGINTNADLSGDITLTGATSNAADAVLLLWYDADDGNAVLSLVQEDATGTVIDIEHADTTITDILTMAMSTTDFGNLAAANFEFM